MQKGTISLFYDYYLLCITLVTSVRGTKSGAILVSHLRLVLAKGVETIAERYHAVATQGIILNVLEVVPGNGTLDVVRLVEQVYTLEHDSCILAGEERVRDLGIPQPHILVVTVGVTFITAVSNITTDSHTEGQVDCKAICTAKVVHCTVVACLNSVEHMAICET